MKEKRKRYTEEFKSDAVRLVVLEGPSRAGFRRLFGFAVRLG